MNSYNHYAFGSVMAWVYRFVAGIDTTTEAPGFHEIVIHPLLDNGITSSRAEYQSPYGTIATDWNGTAAGPFSLRVTIPPNATATVYLPLIPNAHVTEDGNPVQVKEEGKNYVVQVGSGTYNFRVQ
jgi:alpha-L-rhamnosidase